MTKTYTVKAQREGKWWALSCEDVGAYSQVKRLDKAAEMIREAISMVTDEPEDSFDIKIEPVLSESQTSAIERLSKTRTAAEAAQSAFKEAQLDVVELLLRKEGLSVRDAGEILNLSPQRISQVSAELENARS